MRRYEKGVVVGEPDPAPTTTLVEWLEADLKDTQKMIDDNVRRGLAQHNATLVGRVSMTRETLHEIEKRNQ